MPGTLLDAALLRALPYPVAAAFARAATADEADRTARLAAAARALLRFASAVLLVESWRGPQDAALDEALASLGTPSGADWARVAAALGQHVSRRDAPAPALPGLVAWCARADGARSLVTDSGSHAAEAMESALADAVRALPELRTWGLVRVLTAAVRPQRGFQGMLQPLAGPDELTEPVVLDWQAALEVDGIYLQSPDGSSFLDLRPLVQVRNDARRTIEHVWLFDGLPSFTWVSFLHDETDERQEGSIRAGEAELAWTEWVGRARATSRLLVGDGERAPAAVPERAASPSPPGEPAASAPHRAAIQRRQASRPASQEAATVEMSAADIQQKLAKRMAQEKAAAPAPVAPAPVAPAPVVSAPVVSAPVAPAPVAPAPVVSAPVVSAPVVSAPVVSAPVVSAPVAPAPVADELLELVVSNGASGAPDLADLWEVLGDAPALLRAAPASPAPSRAVPQTPLARFLGESTIGTAGMLATGARLGGRYRIERSLPGTQLARGFVGLDETMGRRVLLRVPDPRYSSDPAFRARFEAEIRKLLQLSHQHVVRVLDVGEENGRPFAAMQLLEGGDLDERLGKPGVSLAAFLAWMEQVADALDSVHDLGHVHRDVEPRNILFDGLGNAYLGDFGVARAMGAEWTKLTQAGVLPCAAAYMPPEGVDESEPGREYDQYSLAVILYHALAKTYPHDASSPMAQLMAKRTTPPRPLAEVADVPEAASRAIMKALEVEPARRYRSCTELLSAFRAACGAGGILDGPVARPRAAHAPGRSAPEGDDRELDARDWLTSARASRPSSEQRATPPSRSARREETDEQPLPPPVSSSRTGSRRASRSRARTIFWVLLIAILAVAGWAGWKLVQQQGGFSRLLG